MDRKFRKISTTAKYYPCYLLVWAVRFVSRFWLHQVSTHCLYVLYQWVAERETAWADCEEHNSEG